MKRNVKLSICGISKTFYHKNHKPNRVLKNISLEVFENEIVSIIAPSGAGKSTLFDILTGIQKEDEGRIILDGEDLYKRKGFFGYMFQDPTLFPWRTVAENISLSFQIKGMEKKEALEKAKKLLSKFNLFKYANLYPYVLSGGMKQKVALLRTIAFNSDILLLDEPFGSLDTHTRSNLHLYLLSLCKKLKLTVIFTTHDIREAILLSDRIYVLGKKPSEVIECLRVNKKTNGFGLEKKLIELLS